MKRLIKSGKSGGRSGRAGIGRRCPTGEKRAAWRWVREKRRMAQLAVCLARCFWWYLSEKGISRKARGGTGDCFERYSGRHGFQSCVCEPGPVDLRGEPILDTLGTFGWRSLGEAVTVPDGEGQVSTPLFRAQAAFSAASPHVRMR